MLPKKKYDVLLVDPPWSYGDKGFGKRPNDFTVKGSFAPEAGRYQTMSIQDIKLLPIKEIANKNSSLLLWATSPLLPEALDTMDSWGFKYKTIAFCWSKYTSNGREVANLGQWTLGNIELCLLGTRGHPKRVDRTVRQLVRAERTIHSRKPEEVRRRIEQLFGDVPRIELFARGKVPGWDVWGNEAES